MSWTKSSTSPARTMFIEHGIFLPNLFRVKSQQRTARNSATTERAKLTYGLPGSWDVLKLIPKYTKLLLNQFK